MVFEKPRVNFPLAIINGVKFQFNDILGFDRGKLAPSSEPAMSLRTIPGVG
jgi:hypothetical protein